MNVFVCGNLHQLSSFSIVNRHLIRGLRRRGHRVDVFPSDAADNAPRNPPPPDVYLFHGHPWEARSAPGRLNVFALNYEYLAADGDLRDLVVRLNAAFDLVLVPAAFLRPVLAAAGLRLPIEVVPWGFDPAEFHPRTRAIALPTAKRFLFLFLGAANRRKGIDTLLQAYGAEFGAGEDVALVVKEAPRHPTWQQWADDLQQRAASDACRGAEVVWLAEQSSSVARYFAAADVGVFPHRGEGFGLPILECIASGRPVIVTDGTGPAAFCHAGNARRIRARRQRHNGRIELEPSVRHLRALLRAAFERGSLSAAQAVKIGQTVRGWTWQDSVAVLDAALRRHLRQLRRARPARRQSGRLPPRRLTLAYGFHSRGPTSWKKLCTEIDRSLRRSFPDYEAYPHDRRLDVGRVDVVVGQSENCLELLLAARRANPRALIVVHQECTVLGDRVAVLNRERKRCGLAPVRIAPIDFWRNRTENALADRFIVGSSVARRAFLANGFAESAIEVIPYGLHSGRFHFRGERGPTRFLFVGTDPFRKGIRHLLQAWERAALGDAELICCVDPEVLQSKVLLRYLVRNPNVTVRRLVPHREFLRLYESVDCQVLPSLEDTFSVAIGDGMGVGKPAIVSTATGIRDLITHGLNGHVVPAGNVDRLAESLQLFAADRRRLRSLGEAAYETARRYPWARFRRHVADLMTSLWATGR